MPKVKVNKALLDIVRAKMDSNGQYEAVYQFGATFYGVSHSSFRGEEYTAVDAITLHPDGKVTADQLINFHRTNITVQGVVSGR